MMRRFFPLIIALIPFLSEAQFTDDFSDGNFTANPVWSGTGGKFIVNGTNELQSNGSQTATDTLYLSTPSTLINNTEWTFNMNLLFNPTATTNYVKVFLVSDQADLRAPLNGYFIRMGETGGSDTLELWRKDGGTEIRIMVGSTAYGATTDATIKVERDNLGNWTMYSDPLGGAAFVVEGTVLDNTHTSTSFFGVYCRYSTTSRFDQYLFDNFNVQAIVPDLTPPEISQVQVISNNQLDVLFNENVEQTSSETAGNYTVDNGINSPTTATRDGGNNALVHLTFGSTFTNSTTYELIANNIQDLSTNTQLADTAYFTFFIPQYRDVIISEIFADPSPQIGLPDKEFIELHNTSTSTIDLAGFEFSDASTTATLGNYSLSASGYLILCAVADTASFSPFGSVLGISPWPSLNNSGDQLSLKSAASTLIDEVNYLDDWYQDGVKDDGGWSLEIINPDHPCSLDANWIASTNVLGGTPGMQNSVYDPTPDSQAPSLLQLEVLSNDTLKLTFDEPLDTSGISALNFSITTPITVDSIIVLNSLKEIKLVLAPVIDTNVVYVLSVSGINDCVGNVISTTVRNFGIGRSPSLYDIVIHEIFPDPTPQVGLPEEEFVEIYNRSGKILDMAGCMFTDPADTMVFTAYQMMPDEHLILSSTSNQTLFQTYGNTYAASGFPSLTNAGEVLSLLDPGKQLIHLVDYKDDWYKDSQKEDGGWTLEMVDADNPCAGSSNWAASENASGGTPGQANSIAASNPDLTAPQIDRAIAIDNITVRVSFNELLDAVSVQSASFSINNGININTVSLDNNYKDVYLILSDPLQTMTVYTVTVGGVEDCIGNSLSNGTADFALPEPAVQGDIIINEILFNPRTGGSDFVELYNNSSKYIDIKDWVTVKSEEDTNFITYTITNDYYVLAPGDYMAFSTDAGNISSEYSKAVNLLEVSEIASMSDDAGSAILGYMLIDDSLIIADRFDYDDNMHYSLIDDVNGVSLERIEFDKTTNDGNNWHSASFNEGYATPGYKNSQQLNITDIESGITILPEVFTPDEDGLDDFTTINYNFNEIGYTLNITIFDSHGRLSKTLVQNELIGREGFYQWDGTNDDGLKANVGYYVILFEVLNLEGKVEKFKKKVVVGARF